MLCWMVGQDFSDEATVERGKGGNHVGLCAFQEERTVSMVCQVAAGRPEQ